MSPDDPRHGTNAGYGAHVKCGVSPCQPCKDAHATYCRRRRARQYLAGADTLRVPILVVERRIRALQAIGWDLPAIGRAMGYASPTNQELAVRVSNLCGRRGRRFVVNLDTANRAKKAYDELSGKPGPSLRARLRAQRRGWAPPLAWDDIDDPTEKPTGFNLCANPECAGQVAAKGLCITHYHRVLRLQGSAA